MILEWQMKVDHSAADSNLNKMVGVAESQIQYPSVVTEFRLINHCATVDFWQFAKKFMQVWFYANNFFLSVLWGYFI